MLIALTLSIVLLLGSVPAHAGSQGVRQAPPAVSTLVVDGGSRGEGTAEFERLSGADRYATAVAVSTASYDRSSSVVIATGERYPDALCGGPLAYALDAPLLLARRNSVPAVVLAEIRRLGATHAVILGGESALSSAVEDALRAETSVFVIDRLAGADRYETSALIADELAERTELSRTAMIATGSNYPDALALAPYAAKTGSPILLVRSETIPPRIEQALGQLDVDATIVAGGPNAISEAVASRLPAPVRLGGANRYETARLIAEHGTINGLTYNEVTVATGVGFADALAAGPFSAVRGGPLVLTAPAPLSPPAELFVESHCASIEKFWVVGGPSRVTPQTVDALLAASLVEIPDTTVVLDDASAAVLESISEDDSVLTFSGTTPLLAALTAGDIIVSEPIPLAPMGMLRKVVSVSSVDGRVVVNTVQGTIEEALGKASVDLNQELDPAMVMSQSSLAGVSLAQVDPNFVSSSFYVNLDDVALPAEGDLQARLDGGVRFDSRLIVNMSTKWLSLNSFVFRSEFEETAEIAVTVEAGSSIEEEVTLLTTMLSPITVVVAGVPVVLTPQLSVIAGIDGTISVGMTAGVTQTAMFAAGVAYEDGSWRSISERSNSFTYNAPEANASLSCEVYAGPKLAVYIYGVVGPTGTLKMYLELTAEALPAPSWELQAGLKCDIGVEVSIFSWLTFGHSTTVIDFKRRLAGSADAGLTGTVTNAERGTPVGSVDVIVYRNGSRVADTRTSGDGRYLVSVPAGSGYTLEFSRIGYVTYTSESLTVGTGLTTHNASLLPLNDGEEITIVLTWGEHPWDLDSHLTGPSSMGDRFHVFFASKSHWEDGVLIAALDVDDTFSYGPETITLYEQMSGTYRYSVHDYTNRYSTFGSELANSGAEVHLYRGNALVRRFVVPQGNGTLWTVFELNGDDVRTVNSMSYVTDPWEVTGSGGDAVNDAGVIARDLVEK